MANAIDDIRNEHKTMRWLLDLLEAQIHMFENGERPDYDLIKEVIDYFLTFPDLFHHPKEDMVYRKLKLRNPAAAGRFGDLEDQHERGSDRLHRFTRAVVNVMLEAEIPRETFVGLARDFVDGERKHMDAEEALFFPAALEALTEDDWHEIGMKVDRFTDPLSPGIAGVRFGLLAEHAANLCVTAD
ncbi:MAG: hemerythrin domain-containing protein [Pseudomonadota bacterium]